MKVLLDEDLPHALRLRIQGHEVSTVYYPGWSGLKNGALLAAAEQAGFDILMTGDKKLRSQQNLEGRRIALLVLSAQEWNIIQPHLPAIQAAVDAATPGSYQLVDCGEFHR